MENSRDEKKIKCIVWDLDNTLWDGILSEGFGVSVKKNVVETIKALDKIGILHSIASKNNHDDAIAELSKTGLANYFLYPKINWNSKSLSIDKIVKDLNIGIDSIAFVDDQSFERDEVASAFPEVLCIDACDIDKITNMPEFTPRFITSDSKKRRSMYISGIRRKNDEDEFSGAPVDFLSTLNMKLKISFADEEDLKRAEELTIRTHQLNTTGYTYSFSELNEIRNSKDHRLYIVELEDKYGTYGKIGLVLVECKKESWCIKLLLMSCRVMSRGIGNIIINYILSEALKEGVSIFSELISTDRNRMMYMTYKFNGFYEVEKDGAFILFQHDLENIGQFPQYMEIETPDAKSGYCQVM